jgi:uncharacterized delta-60 repeat protein
MKTSTRFRRARLSLERLEDRDVPTTGGPDESFSGNGRHAFNIDGTFDYAAAVAVQADGKTVVVGAAAVVGSFDFGIARLNRDGSLDSTFYFGNGRRNVGFNRGGNDDDRATCVAIQSDGKIVVGGFAGTTANGYDFAICRLNPDGTLDNTFSGDGKVSFDFNGEDDRVRALVLSGTKILVAGDADVVNASRFAVAQLTSSGDLDISFSVDGKQTVAFAEITDPIAHCVGIALQSDGKIILGGLVAPDSGLGRHRAVVRLHTNGNLDTTFGELSNPGKMLFSAGLDSGECSGLAVQPDNKIILVGSSLKLGIPNHYDFFVARLTANGMTLDGTFGGDGTVAIGFDLDDTKEDIGEAVVLQPDGKIVVAGTVSTSTGTEFAVCRLLGNGSLDTTFHFDGKVTVDVNSVASLDEAYDVALSPEGIVVVGRARTDDPLHEQFGVIRLIRDQWVVVSADQGGPPTVKIFTPTGTLLRQFDAYGAAFTGGVRVALGDVNGDSVPDLFCAPGPGGSPIVNIFDGLTFNLIRQIQVYGLSFTRGVNIAVGNVRGNANLELVTAPDVGGAPFVNIFRVSDGSFLGQIQVFGPTFTLGVRLALGDVAGSSEHKEILVAAQAGGAPVVNIFDGSSGVKVKHFQWIASTYTPGLYLATGYTNTTGRVDLFVGAGSGRSITNLDTGPTHPSILVRSIYPVGYDGGVRVGIVNYNGGVWFSDDVICVRGKNTFSVVSIFDGQTGELLSSFLAFDNSMTAGLLVAGASR